MTAWDEQECMAFLLYCVIVADGVSRALAYDWVYGGAGYSF